MTLTRDPPSGAHDQMEERGGGSVVGARRSHANVQQGLQRECQEWQGEAHF